MKLQEYLYCFSTFQYLANEFNIIHSHFVFDSSRR